jgi:hypothetical protein
MEVSFIFETEISGDQRGQIKGVISIFPQIRELMRVSPFDGI